MFRKLLCTMLMALSFSTTKSQSSLVTYATQINTMEQPSVVVVLSDGRYAFAGISKKSSRVSFIEVLHADGSVAWRKIYELNKETEILALLPLADGGLLLGGENLACDIETDWGFMARLDADGNQMWLKQDGEQGVILHAISDMAFGEDKNSVWCVGGVSEMTKISVADGTILAAISTPFEVTKIARDASGYQLVASAGMVYFDGIQTFSNQNTNTADTYNLNTVLMPDGSTFATLMRIEGGASVIFLNNSSITIGDYLLDFDAEVIASTPNGLVVAGSMGGFIDTGKVVKIYDPNITVVSEFGIPSYFSKLGDIIYHDGNIALLGGESHGYDWPNGFPGHLAGQNLILQEFTQNGVTNASVADASVTSIALLSEPTVSSLFGIENIQLSVTITNTSSVYLSDVWLNVHYEGWYIPAICPIYAEDAFHFTGLNLASGQDTTVLVSPSMPIYAGQTATIVYDICAWPSSPNRQPDINHDNDSQCTTLTDTETLVQTDKFKVLPNPSADFIQIEGGLYGIVSIYNLHGQCLLSTPFTGANIDISCLNTGVYIVDYQLLDGKVQTCKLIKI